MFSNIEKIIVMVPIFMIPVFIIICNNIFCRILFLCRCLSTFTSVYISFRYYTESLACGDCNNLRVFRVASLWLNNCTDAELQIALQTSLDRIPSHKFLPVLPQLIVRISDAVDDPFTKILHKLIG